MQISPWDLIAPGYWTKEQERVLAGWRNARPRGDSKEAGWGGWRFGFALFAIGLVLVGIVVWTGSSNFDHVLASSGLGAFWQRLIQAAVRSLWLLFIVAALLSHLWGIVMGKPSGWLPHSASVRQARLLRCWQARLLKRGHGDPQRFAEQLHGRNQVWLSRLGQRPRAAYLYMLPEIQRWFSLCAVLVFFDLTGRHVAKLVGGTFESHFMIVSLAFLVPVIAMAAGLPLVRRRLRRALTAGRCPSCGYDLRACPPALDLETLQGVNIGPARCPECGSMWPLVPPPVSPTGCSLRRLPVLAPTPVHAG